MSDLGLPAELLELLCRQVDPLAEVEVLLLLHGAPERAWRAEAAAAELRVDARTTARHLAALVAGRLLQSEGDPPAYRYAPASPTLHAAVVQLRALYDTRPVSLVRLLYEGPSQAVRSFADAFRIRRTE